MNLFNLLRRRRSAPVARERLEILLQYERSLINQTDLIAVLREDLSISISLIARFQQSFVELSDYFRYRERRRGRNYSRRRSPGHGG